MTPGPVWLAGAGRAMRAAGLACALTGDWRASRCRATLPEGPVPEPFLVALAVLGLLSETAGEQPLVCVVDDQQWLDQAAQAVLTTQHDEAQAVELLAQARRLATDGLNQTRWAVYALREARSCP
jgi:hypothetical protein